MSAEPSTRTHKVEQGDTLSSLALKYYGDASKWRILQRANKLESDDIFVGEELVIPEVSVPPPPVEPVIDSASVPMSRMEREAAKRGEFKHYQPAGGQTQPPKPTSVWKVLGWITAVPVVGFVALVVIGMVSGSNDKRSYMDRAMDSCRKQYTTETQINDCAIRLGFEKLGEIQRDKMDAARSGVR